MSQKRFHALYQMMPQDFRAELVDGIVFVCEPLGQSHGRHHIRFSSLVDAYQSATPGVQAFDNTSVILGTHDEVQPDICLRIHPERGGQSKDSSDNNYIVGAPELIIEIASSSYSIDLHMKKQRYQKAGVNEYIVLCLNPFALHWFCLKDGPTIVSDRDGIKRSRVFPGLWVDENGMRNMDYEVTKRVLEEGISSAGHADFVRQLSGIEENR